MAWSDIGNTGSNSGEGTNKPKYTKLEGRVTLRILDEEPKTRWTHWIPSMNGNKGGSVNCIGKETCPVCKIMAEDKAAGRPKRYSSSKKHDINVLNRATNEVEILSAGETVFEGLKNIMITMGDLNNIDVLIQASGQGKQKKYSVLPVINDNSPKPLSDAEKALPRFDLTQSKPLTPEQIVQLIEGASYKDIFQKTEEGEVDFTQE